MNSLGIRLVQIARDHLLRAKWLIVPSLRVGHQWLDMIVRNGHPLPPLAL